LVEAQRRLIALLREKRQADISHAVTKGLNPAAPMKDTGIEWLRQIPAHWEVGEAAEALGSDWQRLNTISREPSLLDRWINAVAE